MITREKTIPLNSKRLQAFRRSLQINESQKNTPKIFNAYNINVRWDGKARVDKIKHPHLLTITNTDVDPNRKSITVTLKSLWRDLKADSNYNTSYAAQ